MICPKCGQENSGNYCSYCGARLFAELAADVGETLDGNHIIIEGKAEEKREHDVSVRDYGMHGIRQGEPGEPAGGERTDKKAVRGESRRKLGKGTRKESRRESGKESRRDSRKKAAADKDAQKAMGQRDSKISRLEGEVEQLNRLNRQQRGYAEREQLDRTDGGDQGPDLKELAVKGVTGITVLSSRLMQLACGLLMAYMTWQLTTSFWNGRQELGNLGTMIGDRKYQLALYTAVGGSILFFGVLWTLWILSKKDGGGSVRLKKYDTGRGFLPFLLCLAIAFLIPMAAGLIPPVEQITDVPGLSVGTHVWKSLATGGTAAIHTIANHRAMLISGSALGLIFSTARKILRV